MTIHAGDLRLDRSGRFDGMVAGRLTIAAGLEVEMAGMVAGGLLVEPGARVLVSGMVRGGIAGDRADIRVSGLVAD